jgi:2,3-bisphosphoglycerate-independent phosphoglycerate mutase
MKALVVVAAGIADRPLEELGGRTPLEAAATPNLDRLAREGRLGRLVPAPPGRRPEEGAWALGIFGLDPLSYGDVGSALDAAAQGVEVGPHDLVLRLSLVSADERAVYDATAGGIGRDESALLLADLAEALHDDDLETHPGPHGGGLLLWRGARDVDVQTVPPYDLGPKGLRGGQPRGTGAGRLLTLIDRSREVFARHEVNELRRELGENVASLAWPWGPGVSVPLPDFTARTGLEATAVGVNPTFLGAARLQGLPTHTPEGATGRPGSNLRAKTEAALAALEHDELAFVHADGCAAASLACDFAAKVEEVERLDGYVVGLALRALDAGLAARLVVLGGEAASAAHGRYLADPVPFALYGRGVRSQPRAGFREVTARDAGFQVDRAHELLDFLLHLPS